MEWNKIYTQYMYSYPHKSTYERIPRLDLSQWKDSFLGREMGLYFHIPFCESKCGFCNLFSVTGTDHQEHARYLDAIERHSEQMRSEVDLEQTRFTSLVLGGGTPMILAPDLLERSFLLAEKDYRFDFEKGFSVIESSPGAIDRDKLKILEDHFFKRLSIGVQSFIEEELRILERFEKLPEVYGALEMIRKHKFRILNLDLIYGIPDQTERSFLYSLQEAMRFEPEEIFLYPLYKQPNARLYHKFEMDHRSQYQLYQIGRDFLKSQGYHQLSMRSFSKTMAQKPDCGFENTLSLGCGGRSYFDELHFCEPYVSERSECEREYRDYVRKKDFLKDLTMFILDPDERKRKYAIKNLLYVTGLSEEDYRKHFGSEFLSDFPFVNEWIEKGYVHRSERSFLTEEGMGLSDQIGPMFMSSKVRKKMGYD
ncbi:MAG: STM4012 family radical SAM protein [Peptostreptococcaceae bacterium]|nr:STM4012 family radical SAM protein [Peptostreptococcaceae bacterium]